MPDPTPVNADLDTADLIGKTFDVHQLYGGVPTRRITVIAARHSGAMPFVIVTATVHRGHSDRADSLLLPYGESTLTEVDDA